jgi:hypothetical protein
MKKTYITPGADLIPIIGIERPLCASTDALAPLQEQGDLDGMDWNYNG